MMEDYEGKIIEIDARSKSNTKRIDDLDERLKENEKLITTVQVMATEMGHMKQDISSMDCKLDKLIAEPGNAYKDLKSKVLWAILAAVIGYLLGFIGLS